TDKVAWISFDDNYRSWHTSLKLFEDLDVKATFYVNTVPFRGIAGSTDTSAFFDRIAHQGERVALSVPELLELAAAGHVIGAHTHTHRNLAGLSEPEAIAEISDNVDRLSQILSTPVEHFAVPFGLDRYFPRSLVPWCQNRGITTIAYATPGMQYAPKEPLALQRTPWRFTRPANENWDDLRVDGRAFVRLTGRSPVG
ncbi:MAG: polysaccharide deacetylase family protein, partial [Acidimicrobiia bacterium]